MYLFLLHLHAILRWLVLLSLLNAIFQGAKGWMRQHVYTKTNDVIRHVAATIAHLQLTVGAVLYFNSPAIAYFWEHKEETIRQPQLLFFGLVHISLMTFAVVLVTIGSAKAKRETADREKFRTMTIWYGIALTVIIVAIPWPFSPLAARPYFR